MQVLTNAPAQACPAYCYRWRIYQGQYLCMADFVLVHSPVTGPATWRWLAAELTGRGHRVSVPAVPPGATSLGWPAFVGSVAALARGTTRPVVVGHSGAGPLLPMIGDRLGAGALVFVDADVPPESGSTPLVPEEFLEFLRGIVVGKRLPPWSEWFGPDEMAALVPQDDRRALVCAELPSLPMAYFEDRSSVPDGWTSGTCGYVQLSDAYAEQAAKAEGSGWPVVRLAGQHLDIVTQPVAVADAILAVAGLAGLAAVGGSRAAGRSGESETVPGPKDEQPAEASPAGPVSQPDIVSRSRVFRRISRSGRRS